jgi:predicted nucleotidyltransferase
LSTVRITYFDRRAVRAAVEQHARELAARYPEIEEIVLFGSLARGTPVPGSDADLLIVLCESDRRFLDRIPAFLPSRFPVGVDVFPYTRAEVERMLREGNTFLREAFRDGEVLFRRTLA